MKIVIMQINSSVGSSLFVARETRDMSCNDFWRL